MTSCAAVAKCRYPGSPPRSAPPQGPAALPLPPPHAICAAVPFLAPRATARNGAGSLPFSGARLAPCPMARRPPLAPSEQFSERAERGVENAALRREPRLYPSEPPSLRFCVPGSRPGFSRSCPASRYGQKREGGPAAPSAVPCFSPRGVRRLSAGSADGESPNGGSPRAAADRESYGSPRPAPERSAQPPRRRRSAAPSDAAQLSARGRPAARLHSARAFDGGRGPARHAAARARSAAAPLPPFTGKVICL